MAAEADGLSSCCSPRAPARSPDREELVDFIVDLFLRKVTEAAGYQRFARCYSRLYRAQPELTKCIYDQFICHLQASFREEIQELKDEGNLTELLGSLDKLVEEAKQRELPAWRPSGLPEEDVRSAMVPYFLKQRKYLQKALKEREEGNATLARAVLAGREKIADLHEEIRRRKEEWQATVREGREIVNTLDELP